MVESAAVRDISEASIYQGASPFSNPAAQYAQSIPSRIRYPETVHQNLLLCLMCYPLARYVLIRLSIFLVTNPAISRPCTFARGPQEPCPSPTSKVEGRKESQPCCRRRRGCQSRSCRRKGMSYAITLPYALYYVVARHAYFFSSFGCASESLRHLRHCRSTRVRVQDSDKIPRADARLPVHTLSKHQAGYMKSRRQTLLLISTGLPTTFLHDASCRLRVRGSPRARHIRIREPRLCHIVIDHLFALPLVNLSAVYPIRLPNVWRE